MPAPYATRLRLEGGLLAVAGTAASAALVANVPQSRRWPLNTVGQLALVGLLLARRGPATVDAWMAASESSDPMSFTGEPTPLHHVPVPMLVGVVVFKGLEAIGGPLRPLTRRAGWDASLRVTAGSAMVGIFQATVLARRVAAAEQRERRTYIRLPGSRLGGGTRLGHIPGR